MNSIFLSGKNHTVRKKSSIPLHVQVVCPFLACLFHYEACLKMRQLHKCELRQYQYPWYYILKSKPLAIH